jgi:hypothetical protein
MRNAIIAAVLATGAFAGISGAADSLPNPVKTCADVRAYIGPDGTMTMDTFKKVLIAGGMEWNDRREEGLYGQCKATAYVKMVIMSQHVAGSLVVTTRVIDGNGVCKLTDISLDNC